MSSYDTLIKVTSTVFSISFIKSLTSSSVVKFEVMLCVYLFVASILVSISIKASFVKPFAFTNASNRPSSKLPST